MRLLIAPDSFKGTLTSRQAADAIAEGLESVWPDARLSIMPLSDGGEGLVESVLDALGGERRICRVRGPLGQELHASWGFVAGDQALGVVEMAAASGLHASDASPDAALRAGTCGTGELLRTALDEGTRRIVIGLGGSATTDGGTGCASALGVRFFDGDGKPIAPGAAGLARLEGIDMSGRDPRLNDTSIVGVCDVRNPLLGAHGSAATFGPNKGLDPDGVQQAEAALAHLADVTAQTLGVDPRHEAGAGAAGGFGYGLMAFLEGQLRPGIDWVLDTLPFDDRLADCDLVITGEGRLDAESGFGKVVSGVTERARARNVPVVALVGQSRLSTRQADQMGLAGVYAVVRPGVDDGAALRDPAGALRRLAVEVADEIRTRGG